MKTIKRDTFQTDKNPTLFFFFFLGINPWHVEIPRLGVKSEVQLLPAYITATATVTQDPSLVCDHTP